MSDWKDITTYSQGDKERIPRSWQMDIGMFRLIVTRKHGLEGWFMDVHGIISFRRLESEEISDAKLEALAGLKNILKSAFEACP